MNNPSRMAWASTFFMVVALFYAPLAYGCTRPEMLPGLYALLGAGIVAGAISFVLDGVRPPLPKLALLAIGAVLIQGWWFTVQPTFRDVINADELNGGALVDTTLENVHRLSLNSMLMTTFCLASFVVLCGLLNHPYLRRFILLAAATSGVIVTVTGDTLKLVGAPLMQFFWDPLDIYWNDFAFYRYQGNAGAFINLTWPLILVFTRRAYTPTNRLSRKVFWTVASGACAAALFLNASKSALLIGLCILPWPFVSRLIRMKARTLILLAAFTFILIMAALIASMRMVDETAFERMTQRHEVAESFEGRAGAYRQYIAAARQYIAAAPQAGAFGLGPGLFQLAFPYQTSPLGNVSIGLREYAHQDYLQTFLEWGWFGTIWWTILVGGGVYRAFKYHAMKEQFSSKTERHLLLGAILGVMGTLAECMIDFPLQIASTRLFFLVLLALCWISPQLLTRPRRTSVPMRHYRLPVPAEFANEPVTTSSREP